MLVLLLAAVTNHREVRALVEVFFGDKSGIFYQIGTGFLRILCFKCLIFDWNKILSVILPFNAILLVNKLCKVVEPTLRKTRETQTRFEYHFIICKSVIIEIFN